MLPSFSNGDEPNTTEQNRPEPTGQLPALNKHTSAISPWPTVLCLSPLQVPVRSGCRTLLLSTASRLGSRSCLPGSHLLSLRDLPRLSPQVAHHIVTEQLSLCGLIPQSHCSQHSGQFWQSEGAETRWQMFMWTCGTIR